jgi:arsenate reductase
MAETFLKDIYPKKYEVYSAGTKPGKINPYIIKVMAELGFDLSKNKTKYMNEFLDQNIDFVITVCDNAKETCPFFPGAKHYLHHSFLDPASFTGTDDEILDAVRKIRDAIKEWVEETFGDDLETNFEKKELKINFGL